MAVIRSEVIDADLLDTVLVTLVQNGSRDLLGTQDVDEFYEADAVFCKIQSGRRGTAWR